MSVDRGWLEAALPEYELGPDLGDTLVAARHRTLDRDDAIRVLPAGDRFAAVADTLTGLDHPHLVTVHDAYPGLGLLVMEQLTGGSLADRLTAPAAPERAGALGLAVADALTAAHGHELLHQDLTPAALLFDPDGTVKVADLGLAAIVENGSVGPLYQAPEQLTGDEVGPGTDLYALGIVLYQLLAGHPPVAEGADVTRFHLELRPPPLTGVAPELAAVVLRALEKDPAARQPTARAFALELADATGKAFGPGWPTRAGQPLYLDDEVRDRVRAAAARPVRAEPPAEQGPPPFEPEHPPATDDELGEEDRPRRSRLLLVLACAAVLIAAAVVVVLTRRGVLSPLPAGHLRGVDSIAADQQGRLYVSLPGRHIIQRVDRDGDTTTVAGSEQDGRRGDGRPATATRLNRPGALGLDRAGNLYFADDGDTAIRKVSTDGRISSIAVARAVGLAVSPDGRVYLSAASQIFQVATSPYLAVVAGAHARSGFSGDGGPAGQALLDRPTALSVGPDGTLYLVDSGNKRFRQIDGSGRIRSIVVPSIGSPTPVAVTAAPDGTIYAAFHGPEGDRIMAFSDGTTRTLVRAVKPRVALLAAAPDGVYYRDAGRQRSVWQVSDGGRVEQVETR